MIWVFLGTEEGLYCIDLDRAEIARIGEAKKIFQIEYISEEHLLVSVNLLYFQQILLNSKMH